MNSRWTEVALGECCTFRRGLTYAKGDEVASSSNAVLRANNIDLESNTLNFNDMKFIRDEISVPQAKKVQRGSLLLCTASGSKSHLGKVALIEEDLDMAFGGFMGLLVPSKELLPKFFFYLCVSNSYLDFIAALSDGMNINNLKFDNLSEFRFGLPPLPEQERIVAILDEAFANIAIARANTERSKASGLTIFDSALQEIFTAGETTWKYSTEPLAELCEFIVDCEHKTAPLSAEGYPSIRTPNIGKGQLLLNEVNRVSEATYKEWTRRAVPRENDLILAREAPAGNVAVIPPDVSPCLGQRTVLIRPKFERFDSHFLAFRLLEPGIQAKLLAHSTGATVQHINLKDIRALQIGRWPELSEQRRLAQTIVGLRDEAQRLDTIQSQKIASLELLKKSMLHQAFSGNL